MKKIVIGVCACLCSAGLVFAQEGVSSSLSDPDPEIIGVDSARQALREVSVDLFEREGSWNVHISPDNGVIAARLFDGSPAGKEPLPEDAQPASASAQQGDETAAQTSTAAEDSAVAEGDAAVENAGTEDAAAAGEEESASSEGDTKVLGVKVEFFHRGVNSFFVTAARPIPIEGVTKTVSVWVAGRNMDHDLTLLVQDYFGNNFEIYMGDLAFSGWKKMTVAIPPSLDGEHGIVQSSAYYGDRPGLRIVGFRIDCNPMLARGAYYVYFDDLRAVTDLYDIENHDEDDMMDNW